MQPDPEYRQVAELLAAVLDRTSEFNKEPLQNWLLRLTESGDDDLAEVLGRELERAFPV